MKNKINIAELLKDCPKGMELDCTICNGVKFIELDRNPNFPIVVRANNGYEFTFTRYGQVYNLYDAKCVIFPKGKNTWEGFVPPCKFKDGDVVVDDSGAIFLYKQIHPQYEEEQYTDFYCGLTSEFRCFVIKTGNNQHCGKISSLRFATEEEKQKLFQAIKDNGYRWNTETKTLERLVVPKFKVGDRIKNGEKIAIIVRICKDSYDVKYDSGIGSFTIDLQDEWELVPGKFDISTLIPFESRVLIRDHESQKWRPAIWGVYDPETYFPYKLIGCTSSCCIPYEGNEHLINTVNDCNEYYKTWK